MDNQIFGERVVALARGVHLRREAAPTTRRTFAWQGVLIAAIALAMIAVPSGVQASSYVVQSGDTLADIAWSMGVSSYSLAVANGIYDTDMIYVGQVLQAPGGSSYTSASNTGSGNGATSYGSSGYSGSRWIEVDLSWQVLRAYEGYTPVYTSYVSTGVPGMETPTGEFTIDYKLYSQTMYGADFYLPNVPYVMYFYGGYAIHGTYWHNNFGSPMSHGCVNLPTGAAAWLFEWASPGMRIWIHY